VGQCTSVAWPLYLLGVVASLALRRVRACIGAAQARAAGQTRAGLPAGGWRRPRHWAWLGGV